MKLQYIRDSSWGKVKTKFDNWGDSWILHLVPLMSYAIKQLTKKMLDRHWHTSLVGVSGAKLSNVSSSFGVCVVVDVVVARIVVVVMFVVVDAVVVVVVEVEEERLSTWRCSRSRILEFCRRLFDSPVETATSSSSSTLTSASSSSRVSGASDVDGSWTMRRSSGR